MSLRAATRTVTGIPVIARMSSMTSTLPGSAIATTRRSFS